MNIGIQEALKLRYGDFIYFRDSFSGYPERSSLCDQFEDLHSFARNKAHLKYDIIRQKFIKLLGNYNLPWEMVEDSQNSGVSISWLSVKDEMDYLAFMRLESNSLKPTRLVPQNVDIIYHCLYGTAIFQSNSRTRQLTKGCYITVREQSCYSIKNSSNDSELYLLLRMRCKTSTAS